MTEESFKLQAEHHVLRIDTAVDGISLTLYNRWRGSSETTVLDGWEVDQVIGALRKAQEDD